MAEELAAVERGGIRQGVSAKVLYYVAHDASVLRPDALRAHLTAALCSREPSCIPTSGRLNLLKDDVDNFKLVDHLYDKIYRRTS
jgi:hypothetical protein